MSCDFIRLDALLHGELSAEEASRTRAHARACGRCGRELELLRAERTGLLARSRPRPALAPVRRAVLARCEALERRARVRSRLLGGFAFAVTLAIVSLAPLRGRPDAAGSFGEPLASFCDPSVPVTSFSRALHCGGGELVAQAETEFHACLVASPLLPGLGSAACE